VRNRLDLGVERHASSDATPFFVEPAPAAADADPLGPADADERRIR